MAMSDIGQLPGQRTTTRFGKKRKTGVLYVGQYAVLKPVHNCLSGRREVDFYNTVFQRHHNDEHNDDIAALRRFLPRYLGIEERSGVRHIKLENTLAGFRKPCVIDIKMGHVTSDPFAFPEKVAQRRSKYPLADRLGFTLSGITVYLPERGEFEKVDKYTCHNFTLNQVIVEGLGKYFGFFTSPRKDVILCLLHKLKSIRRWFLRQRQFVFYASSLFIAYEGMVQDGDLHSSAGSDRVTCRAMSDACRNYCCQRQSASESRDSLSDSSENGVQRQRFSEIKDNFCNSSEHDEQKRPISENSLSDSSENDVIPNDKNCKMTENICNCCSMIDSNHTERFPCDVPDSSRCRCVSDPGRSTCSLVDVRLIDFTHAFRTTERDDNYISGLENLIRVLQIMSSCC